MVIIFCFFGKGRRAALNGVLREQGRVVREEGEQ